ncbi:MAG: site-specific integrase, partial [Alphaproteobacteria bacterium]|nr:site-specific integrase [Alphaproteobacteria bacterium]
KPSVRARTFEGYQNIVRRHLIPGLGRMPLRALTPMHIQSYYSDKAKSGLANQTIVHHHRLLFQALKHAHNARQIEFNPAGAVRPPKVEREEIVVLTRNELLILLSTLTGRRMHTMVLLAACTGMRRSEVLGLRWSDVDLETGHLTVNQQLEQTKEHGLRFEPPKTRSSRRRITLPQTVIDALRRWRVKQNEEHLRLGVGHDDKRLVFTRRDGEAYSPKAITRRFDKIIRKIDITRITFHGLRHTHLTHLLRDNVNVKVVSARAGHSSVAITLDVYGHLIEGMEATAADAVEDWFASRER